MTKKNQSIKDLERVKQLILNYMISYEQGYHNYEIFNQGLETAIKVINRKIKNIEKKL
jgi:uncharacterized protein (DUF2164 family)